MGSHECLQFAINRSCVGARDDPPEQDQSHNSNISMTRLEQLLEMLQQDPQDAFLNYALALEFAKTGDIDPAIDAIEGILARDENYLGAYYQLGKFYEQTLQPEKAILTYQKGMEIAKKQNNRKTLGELNEALLMLED